MTSVLMPVLSTDANSKKAQMANIAVESATTTSPANAFTPATVATQVESVPVLPVLVQAQAAPVVATQAVTNALQPK